MLLALGLTLAVAAPAGAVTNELAKLLPNDGAGGDFFGYSVAISGTTALVGAEGAVRAAEVLDEEIASGESNRRVRARNRRSSEHHIRPPPSRGKPLREPITTQTRNPNGLDLVPGRLIVQLQRDWAAELSRAMVSRVPFERLPLPRSLQSLNAEFGAFAMEQLLPYEQVNEAALERLLDRYERRSLRSPYRNPFDPNNLPRLADIYVLDFDTDLPVERLVAAYERDPAVVYAEGDGIYHIHAAPNDVLWPQQWGHSNIDTENAWDTAATPGAGVVIAIIDSGVWVNHPDLVGNIWSNPLEIPGNGMDDDGNSFIDDVNGWDFVGAGDNNPDDGNGHGTHVAGIAAASGNNSIGIAGVAYDADIMALKGLGTTGSGMTTDLVDAMWYAINNGADVMNNSWGGGGDAGSTTSLMVDSAHAAGLVVVNSAGNSTAETMNFAPTASEFGLSISALDPADIISPSNPFSNFGVKIDVGAPGGRGSVPAATNPADDVLSTSRPGGGVLAIIGYPVLTSGGDPYMSLSGTSQAAPHVSGLAAMLISMNPGWTNEEVRSAVRQTSDDPTSFPGFDTESGHGRINADSAVNLSSTPLPTANIITPNQGSLAGGFIAVSGFVNAPGSVTWSIDALPAPTPGNLGAVTGTPVPLASGSGAIGGGLIANVNTGLLADGFWALRLTVNDTTNGTSADDYQLIDVDNVRITDPIENQVLTGNSYLVEGVTGGTGTFINWVLEWAPGANSSGPWTTIASSPIQITTAGPLGTWNYTSLAEGQYTLRLTANFVGFSSDNTQNVFIDLLLIPGWPAAYTDVASWKSPKFADLENDGSPELIFGASVYEANGTLKAGWTASPGAGRTNPAIVDVDGDGELEVVAAEYTYGGSWATPTIVTAYNPDHSVAWTQTPANPWSGSDAGLPSSVAAGDVDGDGNLEIVYAMLFYSGNPAQNTRVFVVDAATGVPQTDFTVAGPTRGSLALADIDADGAEDIIVATDASGGGGTVHVVDSSGTALPGWPGTLGTNVAGSANLEYRDPMAGDFDVDGFYEINVGPIVFNHDGSTAAGWPFGSATESGSAAGFFPDGDCEMELVLGGVGGITARMRDHDNTHITQQLDGAENINIIYFTSENASRGSPIIADVDGDGELDVIGISGLSFLNPTEPSRLYGSPTVMSTAAPAGPPPTGFPRFVPSPNVTTVKATTAYGDLDGDGMADLATALDGNIFVWDLGVPLSDSPWPMFQRDLRNSGSFLVDAPVQVSGGNVHTIALTSAGTVLASGRNNYGQLGNGTTTDSNVPTSVLGVCGATQVSTALNHNMALLADGTVATWGLNNNGQLGNGSAGGIATSASVVPGLSNVVQIAAGGETSMALRSDGTVWAWGVNPGGYLGVGTSPGGQQTSPAQVTGLSNVVQIASGEGFRMARLADGSVMSWGRNLEGQLGDGTNTASTTPVQALGLGPGSGVIDIDGGGLHAMALDAIGTVYTWGRNHKGQLGTGGIGGSSNVPAALMIPNNAVEIEAGLHQSVARDASGTVWTWGYGAYGQLGTGSTADTGVPAAVGGLGDVTQLGSGYFHVLALESDSTVMAWGLNADGDLGVGNNTLFYSTPVVTLY